MGSDTPETEWDETERISIHAPRVGSDRDASQPPCRQPISIHAPRVGSDCRPNCPHGRSGHFNPRSPGGERLTNCPRRSETTDFNPRSPGGERPARTLHPRIQRGISIHAPRVGSDDAGAARHAPWHISIHAPRVGSDRIRAPVPGPAGISIHAPRVGSDWLHDNTYRQGRVISIHAPRVGSDWLHDNTYRQGRVISIHAPRVGSDRENGHLRPRYGQNHPFSTLIVSQIVVDVLGTVRKSQKHQRTSHYEVIKQPERRK